MQRNKRLSPRKKYITPVIIITETEQYSGYINDISAGGAWIKTNKILEINTEVNIKFFVKNFGFLSVKSRAIWSNKEGFGVQFIEPTVELVHWIGKI